jgi:hypothetical protein
MATRTKLSLTRDQLASFLQDHEQIKQFERLFATVDSNTNDIIPGVEFAAGNSGQAANDALAQIAALAELVALINTASDANSGVASLESRLNTLAESTANTPKSASEDDIAVIQSQLQALALSPPQKEFRSPRYGSFYDTTIQTAAAINTAYAITFNTIDLSVGVTRGTPTSRIYVDRPNVYNVQFSAQLDKTSGGVGLVWIWLRKNGVNVPDSAGQIRIQGNSSEILAAWNYVIQLNAGDYIELMWEVDDTSVILLAEAASAVHPSVPSVILTVTDNISSLET